MNYKVLYRKYRPDGFDSLIGQKHVVDILKNSIKEQKLAHAYLFSGPRGTGKTSTARILAKSINCLDNKSGIACGKCENCLSFNGNPDIIEIDAASNNGVDEIRELINNVKIMPTSLKYKVYIIDEVHMLSQSAFNALLLTLEEPPAHVIFILATTNLESVPITIVSRCQRFEFHRITDQDIIDRLKFVCDEEKIEYEIDGLQEIATLADGGLRDALSILDQLSKNEEVITSSLVSNEIGSISNKKIEDLLVYLDNNNINGIESLFNDLQSANLNYKVFIKKLILILSEKSVKVLSNPEVSRLSFDDYKNLVIELNNILMKINISVNPYLLIKMIVLSYIENAKLNNCIEVNKSHVEIPKKIENKVEKLPKNIEKNKGESQKKFDENVENKNVDIRINNCFVGATKNDLNEMKSKWDEFINNLDDALIKGILSDTIVVAASKDYTIMEVTIPHGDIDLNEKIDLIEDLFNKKYDFKYKFVFIDENKWQKEKLEYINNLKSGYKYTLIEETKEKLNNDIDISDVADIFDINKIEVE